MKRRVFLAMIVMGFSGLVAEILLLRELLVIFSGNELSIGIILANWLILEAFGCLVPGRRVDLTKNRLGAYTLITVLFSLSFPIALYLTRLLKNMLGMSIGESIGLFPIFYSSFLILLPISILHGAQFTFGCRIYADHAPGEPSPAGRVYVYETVGTIIGGIVCTFLLVGYLNAFQVAIGLALLNFIVCLTLLTPGPKDGRLQVTGVVILILLVLTSAGLLFTGGAERLHQQAVQAQWRNHHVIYYGNSPYGNICVIENQGQYIYFLDGRLAFITPIPDRPLVEEFVHLPLLAHPQPTDILILSGGAGGIIHEALKHTSLESVQYAELDPLLLSLLRQFPTPLTEAELGDPRVQIQPVDGRLFLQTTSHTYDLIFVGIMEPSSLQANRFFTREFFSLAHQRLPAGGILVLGAPGSLSFHTDELRDLNSCIFHTLDGVFTHVRVIPGDGRNLFLASDSPAISTLDVDLIVKRLNQRNIAAEVLVPWHIEKKLHSGWQNWFADYIGGSSGRINQDFRPLGVFYSISYWNALHAPAFGRLYRGVESMNLTAISAAVLTALLLYLLLRSRQKKAPTSGIPFAIITTGFAGMLYSLVVIFAFQSVYGYVFSWIGLLVASFMAGAAGGAQLTTTLSSRRTNGRHLFMQIELAILFLSLGLPFLITAIDTYLASQGALLLSQMLFLVIAGICGLFIGSQFPLANRLYLKDHTRLSRTAGLLYASDLLGGWLGGILGAVVLLPVLGLTGTCITVGLLKLASLTVIATQPQQISLRR